MNIITYPVIYSRNENGITATVPDFQKHNILCSVQQATMEDANTILFDAIGKSIFMLTDLGKLAPAPSNVEEIIIKDGETVQPYSFDVDLYAKWDSAEGEQVVKKYMAPGDEWADASAIRKALEELKGRELI